MNPLKPKYYPSMINLDKCTGGCNVLSPKICVPKETKDINVKSFNMITNKNEAKAIAKQISCDCKCKLNSATFNSNKKWDNDTCHCECKSYRTCKKIIAGILANVLVIIENILKVLMILQWSSVMKLQLFWVFYQQER